VAAPAAAPDATAAAATSPPPTAVPGSAPAEAAPPLLTPEQEATAKRHYQTGEQAFAEHRYEVAIAEFTAAYEIMKHPDLLYNLHKAALKLGQKEKAIGYLREYERQRPVEAEQIDQEIAQISAPESAPALAVQSPPPPLPGTSEGHGPPRRSGHALIGIGSTFLVAGAALLGASLALSADTPADQTRNQGMLVTGSFLTATGAVALIGGIVITVKSRSQTKVALRTSGGSLQVTSLF
jgi:tetratricopeptide (TPR) repeat protein